MAKINVLAHEIMKYIVNAKIALLSAISGDLGCIFCQNFLACYVLTVGDALLRSGVGNLQPAGLDGIRKESHAKLDECFTNFIWPTRNGVIIKMALGRERFPTLHYMYCK